MGKTPKNHDITQKFFKTSLIVFIITLAFAIITSFVENWWQRHVDLFTHTREALKKNQCSAWGNNLPADKYIKTYTVGDGDTLLSIAEKQLGNTSLVYQLIGFNQNKYPLLSTINPSLQPGWILSYPDQALGPIQGNLKLSAAMVIAMRSNQIETTINNEGTVVGPVQFDNQTLFPDGKNFRNGDCIFILMDYGFGQDNIFNENMPGDDIYFRTVLIEKQK